MKTYAISTSFLAGVLLLLSSRIFVLGLSDPSYSLEEIIQKFRQSCSWADSVAMNIQSETLIEGSNPGHRRQKSLYYRDGDRIKIIGQDCLLGKTGKLSENHELTASDFARESTDENIILINEKCYMKAIMFPGGTRFGAHIQYTNHKRKLQNYLTHGYYGNFLQGVTFIGGGITDIVDVFSSDPGVDLDTEMINGNFCYVIKAKVPQGTVTAWIAPDKGFNLLKYIIHKSSGDFFNDKPMDETRMEEWTVTVDSIELEKIGDIFIPVSGLSTHKILFKGGETKTTSIRVKRSNIQLRPDFEALGAFKINLPDGTGVKIEGVPGITYEWHGGKLIANIDKYAIEQIDITASELADEEGILTGKATNKKTEVAPNEPSVTVDEAHRTMDSQSDILSESRPSRLHILLIFLCLLVIIVIAWRVFLLRRN
jgi:hypothetical protein